MKSLFCYIFIKKKVYYKAKKLKSYEIYVLSFLLYKKTSDSIQLIRI